MATAIERWENEFPHRISLTRTVDHDEYYELSERLKKHNIRYMLLGGSIGFLSEEDLLLAKLLR